MTFEDVLYSIGEGFENTVKRVTVCLRECIYPTESQTPPSFHILRRLVKRNLTPHELLSLELQLVLLSYLILSLLIILISRSLIYISTLFVIEFLSIRYTLRKYNDFFIDPGPYRFFYYGISTIAFLSFMGYLFLRKVSKSPYQFYTYLLLTLIAVLLFRHYFKSRYGRDYTYGVVEDIKNDMARVFVHDDIAANVKPGRYWLPAVPELRPGTIVKVLVEDRTFRSAKPLRILEVYLEDTDQSSQSSTEPNEEAE